MFTGMYPCMRVVCFFSYALCLQLKDPINTNENDPLKSDKMVGCDDWCKESLPGFESIKIPLELANPCRREVFHTTNAEYEKLLRDQARGEINHRQARARLLKRALLSVPRRCDEGLYCATTSQSSLEALVIMQNYKFATGTLPCPSPG